MRYDSNGLLVGEMDAEGGDTCFHVGTYYFLEDIHHRRNWTLPNIDKPRINYAQALFFISTPQWIRNPLPLGFWGANPNTITRDQLTPHIVCLGAYNYQDELARMFWMLARRGFRFPNTLTNWDLLPKPFYLCDLVSPELFGAFFRSFNNALFIPFIIICDFFLCLAVVIRLFQTEEIDNTNLLLLLIQSRETFPTPLSWLAVKLFFHYRINIMDQLRDYYSAKRNSAVGMAELFKPIVKEITGHE